MTEKNKKKKVKKKKLSFCEKRYGKNSCYDNHEKYYDLTNELNYGMGCRLIKAYFMIHNNYEDHFNNE